MPAVYADPMTLPRLATAPDISPDRPDTDIPTVIERDVLTLSDAPSATEGLGFPVRRALAGASYTRTDPFVMMDQMGAVEYGVGEPRGTDWHPHRGFETVTYLLDGAFQHQDTHGGGGLIGNGDTQWMTAGSGLLHIETPPETLVRTGGLFHGVQLWVNLPASAKFSPPRYQGISKDGLTLLAGADGASLVRLIAGELDGHHGPGSTYTPITVVHATIFPGGQLAVPWPEAHNALVYTLAGRGVAGPSHAPLRTGRLAVFGPGQSITVQADQGQDAAAPALEVLILGGQPIREPVAQYGPFVMNTRDELVTALEDFQSGRLGAIPPGALRPFHAL